MNRTPGRAALQDHASHRREERILALAWDTNCDSGNVNCIDDNCMLWLLGEAFGKYALGILSLLKSEECHIDHLATYWQS